MMSVNVKIEKPDFETASARNRLEAVLQGLVEKNDVEREHMEDDPGKTISDSHNKPSARFPHPRRKKRKEMEDGLSEGSQQKQNTYVIKLFDRSVDLAQFNENTPLYPICRAWMRNNPTVREEPRSPSPLQPSAPEDEELTEVLNGKSQDIYRLPSPLPCPINDAGERVNLRIPSPQPNTEGSLNMSLPPESFPATTDLISSNMKRWKKIRQRWKEASHRNQLRYSESMKILKEMFERQ